MAVESDDDRAAFFGVATFGEEVTWTHDGESVTLLAAFYNATSLFDIDAGSEIVMKKPGFLCAAIDMPAGAEEGDAIQRGESWWLVRSVLPDGTGLIRITLGSMPGDAIPFSLDFSYGGNSQYIPLI